ncbi:hypothetical protein CBNV_gp037 [Clanis bilineata nucleopolyhedrovirus]|uniref:Uncharacterized protein n=1 Tax=Clanis bilineata nucleopolyhedrovirus TaxID=1307957 RepID=Q0N463_9ABAC|nr:hypothetical protein CBNV_gp037 [Clanis bilineata nucleopolyhedrovirus]ABF47380.1 hypothetical protein [Clanis bilineata nucleopolyhedrovirus]
MPKRSGPTKLFHVMSKKSKTTTLPPSTKHEHQITQDHDNCEENEQQLPQLPIEIIDYIVSLTEDLKLYKDLFGCKTTTYRRMLLMNSLFGFFSYTRLCKMIDSNYKRENDVLLASVLNSASEERRNCILLSIEINDLYDTM